MTALKPRPKGFRLPAYDSSRQNQERKAMLSAMVTSMASDHRVMENTPSLKSLYEFLKIKPGERLRAWR